MKKNYLTGFLLLLFVSLFSQSPNWEWSKNFGGSGNEQVNSLATDNEGNLYAVGSFYSYQMTLGSLTLTNNDSTTTDIFIAKYNPQGHLIWAKRIGGASNESALSLCCDASGNICVVGYFRGASILFDADTLNNLGAENLFIAKYNSSGNVIWAKSAGGQGFDVATSVSTDSIGNIYVAGNFESPTAHFDNITLINQYPGSENIFIVKYSPSGTCIWGKGYPESDYYPPSLSADGMGNVYMVGSFSNRQFIFDNDTLLNSNPTGTEDIFVVKYNTNGQVKWSKLIGGVGNDYSSGICNANGNVYVTGYFLSTAISLDSVHLNNIRTMNFFVAKYDSTGSVNWAKTVQGITNFSTGICTDISGNIYISGVFTDSCVIGDSVLLNGRNDIHGLGDIFTTKYDERGNNIWAKTTGANGGDASLCITTYGENNIYVGGYFTTDTICLGRDTMVNIGMEDALILKIEDTIVRVTSGILNLKGSKESISAYPNPSNGLFYFEGMGTGCIIEVFDILGKLVYSSTNESKNTIDLSSNDSGIYFFKIKNRDQFIQEGKLLKR